jgi:protein-tyrosine phosphatase
VYLATRQPQASWQHEWVQWRDFGLPRSPDAARAVLVEAWRRAEEERVEIACGGGRGRTGTALACLAVLEGLKPAEAVRFVRAHYDPRAVETPWQRRFVLRFR